MYTEATMIDWLAGLSLIKWHGSPNCEGQNTCSRITDIGYRVNKLNFPLFCPYSMVVKTDVSYWISCLSLHWRHNGRDSVSNYQPHDCLLNRLFKRRSKKTSELRVTGLCAGNSPATGEFPTQMASYAENVSICWRHHVFGRCRSSSATVTPVKYEWDSRNLTSTFARLNDFLTEKLTNRSLVTPIVIW